MKTTEAPTPDRIPGLRKLWKAAFGDGDAFLDAFFGTAYDPRRSLCITEGEEILAALYWFDVACEDRKLAYVYAVATAPAHRGRGLCRQLMADTKDLLKAQGYAGILLVPQEEGLIRMYAGMGCRPCTAVSEFVCESRLPAAPLHRVDAAGYARCRRDLLPPGSVLQEGENLRFLETVAEFYAGPGFAAAVFAEDGTLHCTELLGDPQAAPGILAALGYRRGFFRTPGSGRAFAMLCPLTEDCPVPAHFGLAFD